MVMRFLAIVGAGTIAVCVMLVALAVVAGPGGSRAETAVAADAPPAAVAATPVRDVTHKLYDDRQRPAARGAAWPSVSARSRPMPSASGVDAGIDRTPAALRADTTSADAAVEDVADRTGSVARSPDPAPARSARRSAKAPRCTHYRTYDPDKGTYRGYDGKLHACPAG